MDWSWNPSHCLSYKRSHFLLGGGGWIDFFFFPPALPRQAWMFWRLQGLPSEPECILSCVSSPHTGEGTENNRCDAFNKGITARGVVCTRVWRQRMFAVTLEWQKALFYLASLWNMAKKKRNVRLCSAQQLFNESWGILSLKGSEMLLKKSLYITLFRNM